MAYATACFSEVLNETDIELYFQALKAISLGSGPHLALLRLINNMQSANKTEVQSAAKAFHSVTKEHPDDFSHFIHTRLTKLLGSPLIGTASHSLARKELKALYAEFYGYNVGIPLTPEGQPVKYRDGSRHGWKTMAAAIADFGSTHGHPKDGWLGKIHEALSELET